MTEIYHQPFSLGRNQPCYCQSGLKFKSCCGDLSPNRKVPFGIEIVENYLDTKTCNKLVKTFDTLGGEKLTVVDVKKTTKDKVVRVLDDRRVTERVLLNDSLQNELNNHIKSALLDVVEPTTNKKIEWFEAPQVLRYHPNGLYQNHADSDNFNPETNRWKKDLDRDISLLMYLNDGYTGGTLYFPNFDFRLQPKAGMLVFFPSDFRFEHAAESLIEGTRYAIVSWSAVVGEIKVRNKPPSNHIKIS